MSRGQLRSFGEDVRRVQDSSVLGRCIGLANTLARRGVPNYPSPWRTLTRLAALGTLSRSVGEGLQVAHIKRLVMLGLRKAVMATDRVEHQIEGAAFDTFAGYLHPEHRVFEQFGQRILFRSPEHLTLSSSAGRPVSRLCGDCSKAVNSKDEVAADPAIFNFY